MNVPRDEKTYPLGKEMINSLCLNVPLRAEKMSYPPFLSDDFYYREDIDESLGNKEM